jgi:ProP effector
MRDNQGLSLLIDSMTSTLPETKAAPAQPAQPADQAVKPGRSQAVQAVLEKLFDLYPHLFGAQFLPLKLGVFQELLAKHPGEFQRDALKLALGVHTRSTRYLQCVAAGKPRYDLAGVPGEAVAPEHVCFALLELYRRKQGRSKEDLAPKLRRQLIAAFEASGLTRMDYLAKVQTKDLQANALLEEALAERDQQLARQTALRRAFDASGKSPEEFAAMYGLDQHELNAATEPKTEPQVPAGR